MSFSQQCLLLAKYVRVQDVLEHFLPSALEFRLPLSEDPLFKLHEAHFSRHDLCADSRFETAIAFTDEFGEDFVLDHLMSNQEPSGKSIHATDVSVEKVIRIV